VQNLIENFSSDVFLIEVTLNFSGRTKDRLPPVRILFNSTENVLKISFFGHIECGKSY